MDLKKSDIVVCVINGDYGKPRPAVIIQSDLFNPTHSSFTICPITSHCIEAPLFRLSIQPNIENGLNQPSQIMVDKIMTLQKEKIRQKIGSISNEMQTQLLKAIQRWLGIDEH
ncbi:MAG: type II toxin-antitoxin system PemK/MazF family toxin [Gammaproteobacteria bacterium]|nr:type II toxin-antitoxin system PemK/MazF family toxin [Gammaproteobacteria bacterium]